MFVAPNLATLIKCCKFFRLIVVINGLITHKIAFFVPHIVCLCVGAVLVVNESFFIDQGPCFPDF